jgi:hypothetical protein
LRAGTGAFYKKIENPNISFLALLFLYIFIFNLQSDAFSRKEKKPDERNEQTNCFGTTDGHLTMDGRQAIDARIEQFRNV